MKKILISLTLASLLLSACGSSDTTSTGDSDTPYFYEYITADFQIDVPNEWEVISAFTSEYPDELRVAFRNNVIESDFVANVNVLRESNDKSLTNADYAQEKLKDHANTLSNYKLISQESLNLEIDGSPSATTMYTFEGKNEFESHTLNFKQVYLTQGDQAWTVTATYLPSEDEFVIERMDTMLRSFTLK